MARVVFTLAAATLFGRLSARDRRAVGAKAEELAASPRPRSRIWVASGSRPVRLVLTIDGEVVTIDVDSGGR